MTQEQFINTVNSFSSNDTPFFFLIDFEKEKPFVCQLSESSEHNIFYNISGKSNISTGLPSPVVFKSRTPISREDYKKSFNHIIDNLNSGNTYLLNLTFPTRVNTDISLRNIFCNARAAYKLLFRDEFTLFSPECFIKIINGEIFSNPMKGTIDASIPDAEQIILADKKEVWEHNTIVDLIRNDLSIVSTDVKVTRFRYIDRIVTPLKNLLQVSSEIKGRLPANWNAKLGEILMSLLPAGSISGAPKKKTVEIIKEAEIGKRGYYTGIFGVFDGKNLDSAVNIRFIEKTDKGLYFRSGGGITANSIEENEYQELVYKVNVPSC